MADAGGGGDSDRAPDADVTVDAAIEHIGGFGAYQRRLFAILGFSFFANGCLNLQQVVVERAPATMCSTFEDTACQDCSDGRFLGQIMDTATVAATFELLCDRAVLRGYLGSVFFFGFGIGSYAGGLLSDRIGRLRSLYVVDALMCAGSLSALAGSYTSYLLLRFVAGLGCGSGIVVSFVLMLEFIGAKHRGWMGGFGMNGLWAVGGVVVGLQGAAVHAAYRDGRASMLYEWQAVAMLPLVLSILHAFATVLLPESPRWLAAQGNLDEARRVLERAAVVNGSSLPPGRLVSHTQVDEVREEEQTFELRIPSAAGQERVSPDALSGSGEVAAAEGADLEGQGFEKSFSRLDADSTGLLSERQSASGRLRTYLPCAPTGVSRQKGPSTRDLFSSKLLLGVPVWQTTMINLLCWFTASFTYYGLALNTGNLAGDFYANFVVNMAVDVPALLVSIPMFDRLGRAWTLAATMLFGGFACVGVTFFAVDAQCEIQGSQCFNLVARSNLAFTGKFMLCITFSGVFLYASEIFPTSVRTQGMGLSSVAARVGGVLAPLIVVLLSHSRDAPMWVFGLVSIFAGIMSIRLPETLGKTLADNI
eukprot:Tamp_11044.p1 GENE.Tamp_11044~~Tamp_11044.p1  ORF type:complete len:605 (+),score=63.72 Tamp_11044:41-1816(+)